MQHGLIAREKSFDERMWHTHKTLEKIDRFCHELMLLNQADAGQADLEQRKAACIAYFFICNRTKAETDLNNFEDSIDRHLVAVIGFFFGPL